MELKAVLLSKALTLRGHLANFALYTLSGENVVNFTLTLDKSQFDLLNDGQEVSVNVCLPLPVVVVKEEVKADA